MYRLHVHVASSTLQSMEERVTAASRPAVAVKSQRLARSLDEALHARLVLGDEHVFDEALDSAVVLELLTAVVALGRRREDLDQEGRVEDVADPPGPDRPGVTGGSAMRCFRRVGSHCGSARPGLASAASRRSASAVKNRFASSQSKGTSMSGIGSRSASAK